MISVLEQIEPGDHIALVYRTRAEQLACAIPYIKLGLARNERCLYIADNNSVPAIVQRLAEAGVDVSAEQNRDALRILTKQETYLRHGVFEPEKMIADLEEIIGASLDDGFTGFRASGEMTWALDLPSSFEKLIDYEMNLDADFSSKFTGLCQYDETRFPPQVMSKILAVHPKVIRGRELMDNPTYRRPLRPYRSQA
jgi:hypothetical protein